MAVTWKKFAYFTDIPSFASAAEDLAGAEAAKAIAPLTNPQLIKNLKLVVNASVNKLDIFTKSGGAVPNATNIISVAIPDGNGFTFRSRAAAYLSGTSQFIMADAAGYWGRASENTTKRDAYVYAIWDANGGIVWALGGYSGFTRVPTTTTITDIDFLLLEASSTYTRVATDYCICIGKIQYQYDTNDSPDHTIYATDFFAPQVGWNLYPVASSQTTGFALAGGTLNPRTLTVTATTSLDEAVAMSSKAPKASPVFTGDVTLAGKVVNATLPAFLALRSATIINETGAGRLSTPICDTEIFDLGGNYAAGVFTAPVTGKYAFSVTVTILDLTAAMNVHNLSLVTSNRTYPLIQDSFGAGANPFITYRVLNGMVMAVDMDAADTAYFTVQLLGGASDSADIQGAATPTTWFSGHLVC